MNSLYLKRKHNQPTREYNNLEEHYPSNLINKKVGEFVTSRAVVRLVLESPAVADPTPTDALGGVVRPARVARPEVVLGGATRVLHLLAAPDGLVALGGSVGDEKS